jgi:hypothetical protein
MIQMHSCKPKKYTYSNRKETREREIEQETVCGE